MCVFGCYFFFLTFVALKLELLLNGVVGCVHKTTMLTEELRFYKYLRQQTCNWLYDYCEDFYRIM